MSCGTPDYPRLIVLAFGTLAMAHSPEEERWMRTGELKAVGWGVALSAAVLVAVLVFVA